ncbi:hypothetical protein DJ66_1278 [Candidatus Liberibacter solanacearum]|uniref:Uncharacterized protein n=1 Tax=Candidatus Liberibacter solanacearum TaxID=556287 RepID=A0A0F4VKZ0_9HYPH|nr:hypothetical protein DJ66_1278 [Candidatus Liberibacter solanacearum]
MNFYGFYGDINIVSLLWTKMIVVKNISAKIDICLHVRVDDIYP